MKQSLIAVLIVLTSITPLADASAQNAVKHLEEVNTPFVEMKREIWQYLKAITSGRSARKVEKKRKKLLQELVKAKKTLRELKAYDGDASLKEAAIEYVSMSSTVLNEDYSKIVDMEEISEQSYDNMEAYLMAKEQANDKLDDASDKFQGVYEAFAAKNNINIVEGEKDELSKKIALANEALEYYNDIFLIFFKSYKQEVYVMDALGRGDVSGMQQNTSSLEKFTAEGLEKLGDAEAFRGSKALVTAAQYMIKFYKSEAEDEFPELIAFHLKKDRMDKMSEAMSKMKESERTKSVIDTYNKESEAFNKAVNDFNETNNKLNSKRQEYLNKWNEAVAMFLNKYSG